MTNIVIANDLLVDGQMLDKNTDGYTVATYKGWMSDTRLLLNPTIGPDGMPTAYRLYYVNSQQPILRHEIISSVSWANRTTTFGVWAKADSASDKRLFLRWKTYSDNTNLNSQTFSVTTEWDLYSTDYTFSSDVDVDFKVDVGLSSSSGDRMDLANPFLYVHSSHVALDTTGKFSNKSYKAQAEHRTHNGRLFTYKWATVERFRVPVEFISSEDQALINSLWNNNTNLIFYADSGATAIGQVRMSNKTAPIDMFTSTDKTLWKGVIELEGY